MANFRNSQYPKKEKRRTKRGIGVMNRFHQALRDYMHEQQITQKQCSERAHVSQSTISRILNAKQSPTVEVVDQLAQVMGRDVSELVYLYLGREIPSNVYEIASRIGQLSADRQRDADSYLLFLAEQQKGDKHQEPIKRQLIE